VLAPSPQSKTAEIPAPIVWRRLLSPSSRRARLISAILFLVTVIGAAYAHISRMPIALKVSELEANVPVRVFGLGTVEARVVSKIGFEVGAAIVELNADHGDVVKQGQVLAGLHATQQEAKAARAKAAVLSAEVSAAPSAAEDWLHLPVS
jgi:HlyD family secretion protein